MPYQLYYHPDIPKKDLSKINRNIQKRIRKAVEQRLLLDPVRFGQPLQRSLKGYRKLRVGDYRVIYEIQGTQIRILTIGHRKDIYESVIRPWIPHENEP